MIGWILILHVKKSRKKTEKNHRIIQSFNHSSFLRTWMPLKQNLQQNHSIHPFQFYILVFSFSFVFVDLFTLVFFNSFGIKKNSFSFMQNWTQIQTHTHTKHTHNFLSNIVKWSWVKKKNNRMNITTHAHFSVNNNNSDSDNNNNKTEIVCIEHEHIFFLPMLILSIKIRKWKMENMKWNE